jgi:tRNA-guanine transglycosylase
VGIIHTPHGTIKTPRFVPVGTQATVKSLTPDELHDLDVQLFFVNTYHTYLRPNLTVIKKFGGLHRFMAWDGPIITDSGGFQVFSLARPKYTPIDRDEEHASLVKITEDGVKFRSHWDGSEHFFTPESSMQYQWTLGSDIHIAFDECTPYPASKEYALAALDRTHRWAVRSLTEHQKLAMLAEKKSMPYQALYGVVQGSVYEDMRVGSGKFISSLETDGIAIGGVSVGETKKEMVNVLKWVVPCLPEKKPRHLLGVGEIDDIFALVEHGMDTFDCVQPTRLARMGRVYVGKATSASFDLDITQVRYKEDATPIDAACSCYTCTHFTKSYLHHLFRVKELLGYRLATIHNIHFVGSLVASIRQSIEAKTFLDLKEQWLYND